MPRTHAGLELLLWAEGDARPLSEYGFETVEQAILAIEAEAAGEAGLRSSAQAYVDALDAAKKAGRPPRTKAASALDRMASIERWADLDTKAAVALADLRRALKAKPKAPRA